MKKRIYKQASCSILTAHKLRAFLAIQLLVALFAVGAIDTQQSACLASNNNTEHSIPLADPLSATTEPATDGCPLFYDVPTNHWYYSYINKIAMRRVTVGCGNGNYCVNQNVTREQMAAFIIRALGEFNPPTPATQRFADVLPSNPFYNFIDRLAALEITLGCGGGNYCPTGLVTRGEIATFLERAVGRTNPPTPGSQRFLDVDSSNGFYRFIDSFVANGMNRGIMDVVKNYCDPSGNYFCPTRQITRDEMAAFLVIEFRW